MEHRTNSDKKSVREELKVEDQRLEMSIMKQKLKYFGHLKRSEGLGKIILEEKIDGKRERGRPRGQWERVIQKIYDWKLAWQWTETVYVVWSKMQHLEGISS